MRVQTGKQAGRQAGRRGSEGGSEEESVGGTHAESIITEALLPLHRAYCTYAADYALVLEREFSRALEWHACTWLSLHWLSIFSQCMSIELL